MEIHNLQLYNADNLEIMATLTDESIDVICIDPPYLYLKNQKLERSFDEQKFFAECKRLLTKKGFIVMFGRGTSFYRWNTILDGLGFVFKEEVIWNKSYVSSPLMPMSRIHETVSILTKKEGVINKVKIPYLEMKRHDIDSIVTDIKRMKSALKNTKSLNAVLEFLENNKVPTDKDNVISTSISSVIKTQDRCASVMAGIQNGLNEKSIIRTDREKELTNNKEIVASNKTKGGDRCVDVMQSIQNGLNEKSIIRTDRYNCDTFTKYNTIATQDKQTGDRCVNVMQSIQFGFNEKTIIKHSRDHYKTIHPTQKPVRLLERLLALVIPKDKPREEVVVADFFAGSMSCMEAVHNMGMKGIATEIDQEYFEKGKQRIEGLQPLIIN
nr:MAG TPA: adenine-specific methyltransferase [Caudoviricetes sp.]DAQ94460.1 MAG TPA: adenine-specific methyltransferase [Caudoviricetes sp.]